MKRSKQPSRKKCRKLFKKESLSTKPTKQRLIAMNKLYVKICTNNTKQQNGALSSCCRFIPMTKEASLDFMVGRGFYRWGKHDQYTKNS